MTIQEVIEEVNSFYNSKVPRNELICVTQGSTRHWCEFAGSEVIDGKVTLKAFVRESENLSNRKPRSKAQAPKSGPGKK
jgi:hypothetical protein